jgi:hypothetical protein
MTTSIKRKSLSVLLVLALVVSLFSGLTINASAADPGAYAVTFTAANVTVYDSTGTNPPPSTSGSDGTLQFKLTPATNYLVTSIVASPNTAVVTAASNGVYTLSNVTAPTTVTVNALATVPYAGQTSVGNYTLNSVPQLFQLASIVNGATPYNYAGSNFFQTGDIALAGAAWTPIGGHSAETGYAPNGTYFAGTYNGSPDAGVNYYSVTGLNITATLTSTTYSGWGLFGAAKGNIANLGVSGSITLSGTSADYVGGIVGYTTASVFNCVTNVTINAGSGSGNVGGIVGAIEDKTATTLATPIMVQYSVATGNVTGGYEVGGIAGGVYCTTAGNAAVDNCAYVGGTVATSNTSAKSFVGGIVGYLKGWLSRSYAEAVTLNTPGGHYLGGAVGRAQGSSSPLASIYNSYADVAAYTGSPDSEYDLPLVSTVDGSSALPINATVWTENIAGYTQPNPNDSPSVSGWGSFTNGSHSVNPLNTSATVSIINSVTNNYFTLGSASTTGTTYPVLTWQILPGSPPTTAARVYVDPTAPVTPLPLGGGVVYVDTDDATQIFVDGTAATNGTGTKASPFNNITSGLAALSAATGQKTIYIRGQVSIPSTLDPANTALTSTVVGATIKRSSIYGGYLFDISGGITPVTNITIDGNAGAFATNQTESLFRVEAGGELDVGSGASLQNNNASYGGAIRVMGGTAKLFDGGAITSNSSALNGGAVSVHTSGGQFLMTGGVIASNTAANDGGAISVYNKGIANISGGTITANTAIGNGGALIVGSGTTAATITGGTIIGNNATLGQGVYVNDVNSSFTVSPASGATFYLADTIYLPTSTVINVGATVANIKGYLTVQCQSPSTSPATVVAQVTSPYSGFSSNDEDSFAYVGGAYDFNIVSGGTQIVLD